MKLITLFFILIAGSAFSQSLIGQWTVSCLPYSPEPNSYVICDLCEMKTDQNKIPNVLPFKISIDESNLTAIWSDTTITTNYTYNESKKKISFSLKGMTRNFDVNFSTDGTINLIDKNGAKLRLKHLD